MDERITSRVRILVVDDDPDQLELVRRTLAPHFDVQTHDSALGVSNLVRHGEPDLVLLDVNFPALTGDQVLSLARRHAPVGLQRSEERAHVAGLCTGIARRWS